MKTYKKKQAKNEEDDTRIERNNAEKKLKWNEIYQVQEAYTFKYIILHVRVRECIYTVCSVNVPSSFAIMQTNGRACALTCPSIAVRALFANSEEKEIKIYLFFVIQQQHCVQQIHTAHLAQHIWYNIYLYARRTCNTEHIQIGGHVILEERLRCTSAVSNLIPNERKKKYK